MGWLGNDKNKKKASGEQKTERVHREMRLR